MKNPLKAVVKQMPPFRAILDERNDLRSKLNKAKNSLEKARKDFFAQRASMLTCFTNTPLWYISSVVIEDGFIEIHGFALPPEDPDEEVTFTINGKPFQEIQYPAKSDMVAEVFWYIPGSADSLFVCKSPISTEDSSDTLLEFSYVKKSTLKPFNEDHNFYHFTGGNLPLPDMLRRRRVHGRDDEYSFRLLGSTLFVKLEKMLKITVGKKYQDFRSILDWGCGCGRLLRYFHQVQGPSIWGSDIDEDNIQWCRDNLPFAQYSVFPIHPPTDLPDSSFDLVFGISILTHLDEDEQFKWLAEIQRICAPGGIALLTVQGESAVCRNATPELRDLLLERGFLDQGALNHLADVIDNKDYYRSIFHTPEYIRKNWTRYFKVRRILPGYVGGFQDLVVLEKV